MDIVTRRVLLFLVRIQACPAQQAKIHQPSTDRRTQRAGCCHRRLTTLSCQPTTTEMATWIGDQADARKQREGCTHCKNNTPLMEVDTRTRYDVCGATADIDDVVAVRSTPIAGNPQRSERAHPSISSHAVHTHCAR